MCWNLATGVPTSGVFDSSQCAIGSLSSSAGLLGQLRQHRGEVDRQLAEQVQRDRADVLQLGRPGRIFAQFPRLRSSTNGLARSARAMISRMARL